jgi:putative ABC transport system substrate-binding protein
MRRREFITLLSGAAAWPLGARAQQAEQVRRIGALTTANRDDREVKLRMDAFFRELDRLGWSEGRNVRVDLRESAGDIATTRRFAAELVALKPDVILGMGSLPVASLLEATRTVPIVFTLVADPVGAGVVKTLARPAGNATGFSMFEYTLSAKWPELLKQIAPHVTRVAVPRDPTATAGIGQFAVVQALAPSVGLEVTAIDAREAREIETSIAEFACTRGWGPDRHGGARNDDSSRSNHRARRAIPAAGGLL